MGSMATSGNPLPEDLLRHVYSGVNKSVLPIVRGCNSQAEMPSQDKVTAAAAGGMITFDFSNSPTLTSHTRQRMLTAAAAWGKPELSTIEQADGTSCVRLVIECSKLAKTWKGGGGGGISLLFILLFIVVVVAYLVVPPAMHISVAKRINPDLGKWVEAIIKGAAKGQ